MTQIGAPRPDTIPIGEEAKPPFVVLPDPASLFERRARRFKELATGHELGPYLHMLAGLAEAQARLQDSIAVPALPAPQALARAHQFAMPPIDRDRFEPDAVFDATFDRLLASIQSIAMPEAGRVALDRLAALERGARSVVLRAVLSDAIPMGELAEHAFAAAALQVHFARLAAQLDRASLVPVGDGACPVCGGPPVASLVVGWQGSHGSRFCACALCATLWNYVRIKCVLCGSTKGIAYQQIAGGDGHVKAETCDECRGYVKILQQLEDPALEPVADDVATLGLDLLVREVGFRRGAFNPFLLGY